MSKAALRDVPGCGRGLVATQLIQAGETIAVHEPLVAVVSPVWFEHVCVGCFASAYPRKWPLACPGACRGHARFCSKACQEATGSNKHVPDSAACWVMRRLNVHLCEEDKDGGTATTDWTAAAAALMLQALVASFENEEESGKPLLSALVNKDDKLWLSLMQLCCLERKDVGVDLAEEIEGIVEVVVACRDAAVEVVLKDGNLGMPHPASAQTKLIARNVLIANRARALLLRSECNAFSYWSSDGSQDQLGLGLFLEAAMYNHTCSPNVGKILRGRTICFVALCAIEPGEELRICYVGLDEDRATRRGILKTHFHFDCACERCTKGKAGNEGVAEDREKGKKAEAAYVKAWAHKGCGGAWVPPEKQGGVGGGGAAGSAGVEAGESHCSLCNASKRNYDATNQ